MGKTKKVLLVLFLLLTIIGIGIKIFGGGLSFDVINQNKDKVINKSVPLSSINEAINKGIDSTYTSNNKDISNSIDSVEKGDTKKSIEILEALDKGKITKDEKVGAEALLVYSYLGFGSSSYNEKTYAEKARSVLNSMEINKESWFYNYYMAYSYEIETQYEKALFYYNHALNSSEIEDKEAKTLNQIGHVYDLQGDMEKANEFYVKAEKLGQDLLEVFINRGRYEFKKFNLEVAKSYFTKVIEKTDNLFIKSEMYFNLSMVSQTNGDLPTKAIEYAKKGIEANKDYPYNYLSLGMIYIKKGGTDIDKAPENLNKVLEIYPNSSTAYKNLGIYYYTKDDFGKAIENFQKQYDNAKKDITLMANEQIETEYSALFDISKSYALKGEIKNSMEPLQKLLDGKNKEYYFKFLDEFSREDGVYSKLIEEKDFKDAFKEILIKYKK